ncbi:SIMPL domain-containing protein [Adhaeribacter soli]|uniref:DUF541 domain-containing protein n=1 Tax=Adhaeribacter soli TaxID=2607655 RepID=A0A5N1J5E8_9BACT|nr:SIMPL domain-containing protein [Adhaeribacter soli]KAA9346131.1 DUF541 domain-containing protein [Adhaeribacter soli]
MKTRKLLSALLLSFIALTSFAQLPKPQPQTTPYPPLVTVSGTGEVKVQPNEIMLSLAVDVRGKTLDEARKQNDEKVASVLAYLKKYGVESKDVQTTYMSVQPIYHSGEYGQTNPDFYSTQKSVNVLIRKIDKFDDLLTGIYKAGANRVDGIEFRTSELKKHREQARKLAVQAAKEKAISLTGELGTKIGRVYAINENSGVGYPMPYRGMAGGMYNKMAEASMSDQSGPTIAGGQIIISSTVEASFVIEQ